jgi:hypothetical protein
MTESYREQIVPFEAGDGFACNLVHIEGSNPPTKGPVLLIHGAGVRANLFRAPVERTVVDHLIDCGMGDTPINGVVNHAGEAFNYKNL